jgi:OFA family oxalate/formate antiporter-like MFS transporter
LVSSYGLNATFAILAAGVAALVAAASLIIKAPAEPAAGPAGPAAGAGACTPSQMVRTAAFSVLALWMVSGSAAGLMVMNSAATIAIFYGSTAGAGLAATVFNGVGRIFFGVLFDRLGNRPAMAACGASIFMSGALMLLGARSGSLPLILIGLPLAGLGYGGSPVITSAFVSRRFGAKHYTANLSIANLAVMASSVAGPLLSGRLQEADGGGFASTFTAIAALGFTAIILSMFSKLSPKK